MSTPLTDACLLHYDRSVLLECLRVLESGLKAVVSGRRLENCDRKDQGLGEDRVRSLNYASLQILAWYTCNSTVVNVELVLSRVSAHALTGKLPHPCFWPS